MVAVGNRKMKTVDHITIFLFLLVSAKGKMFTVFDFRKDARNFSCLNYTIKNVNKALQKKENYDEIHHIEH